MFPAKSTNGRVRPQPMGVRSARGSTIKDLITTDGPSQAPDWTRQKIVERLHVAASIINASNIYNYIQLQRRCAYADPAAS
jgi:hypothetical protein